MTFEQFKRKVIRLAKEQKKQHLIPSSNALYVLWQAKCTPQKCVDNLGS